jgi:hypothetical protein
VRPARDALRMAMRAIGLALLGGGTALAGLATLGAT